MDRYYFLYKEGVYGHGIFWIGTCIEQARIEMQKAAANDCDDYHDWTVYAFNPQKDFQGDAEHHYMFSTNGPAYSKE